MDLKNGRYRDMRRRNITMIHNKNISSRPTGLYRVTHKHPYMNCPRFDPGWRSIDMMMPTQIIMVSMDDPP